MQETPSIQTLSFSEKAKIAKDVLVENFQEIKEKLKTLYTFHVNEIENYSVDDIDNLDFASFYRESKEDIKRLFLEELTFGDCNCENCENICIGESGENRFCGECVDDNFYCENCSGYFNYNHESQNSIGDYSYCENCFSDVGYYCDECGENYYHDNRCSCGDDDDEDGDSGNDDMQFQVFRNFSKGEYLKVSRGAGIELEFSKFRVADYIKLDGLRGKYFFKTHDGSVRGDGVEIVSSVMKGKLMEDKLKDLLKSADVGVDRSCGYHIHINTKDFKPKDIKHLFRTYIDLENIFFSLVPESRQENRFCYRFSSIYEYNKGFVGQKTKYDLEKKFYSETNKKRLDNRKKYKYDGLRYCWANFHSLFSKHNVEIRLHSGTGNYEKIINWIALNVAVVQYVKKYGRLKATDIKDLLLKLLQKDLIVDKTYKFYVDRYNKMKAKHKMYVEEDSN